MFEATLYALLQDMGGRRNNNRVKRGIPHETPTERLPQLLLKKLPRNNAVVCHRKCVYTHPDELNEKRSRAASE
ncbi:hypothetical protein DPMN_153105 [Dreissena polymorpha]|uniref:Uncharacterized protein n=1 Tax=Dreissena polymorpha TaxID=45954 RepID=A0A9D4FIQ2_DREPO|nr:hypothetical protein DPMN_153105 [Dreissena polymorpha]